MTSLNAKASGIALMQNKLDSSCNLYPLKAVGIHNKHVVFL